MDAFGDIFFIANRDDDRPDVVSPRRIFFARLTKASFLRLTLKCEPVFECRALEQVRLQCRVHQSKKHPKGCFFNALCVNNYFDTICVHPLKSAYTCFKMRTVKLAEKQEFNDLFNHSFLQLIPFFHKQNIFCKCHQQDYILFLPKHDYHLHTLLNNSGHHIRFEFEHYNKYLFHHI